MLDFYFCKKDLVVSFELRLAIPWISFPRIDKPVLTIPQGKEHLLGFMTKNEMFSNKFFSVRSSCFMKQAFQNGTDLSLSSLEGIFMSTSLYTLNFPVAYMLLASERCISLQECLPLTWRTFSPWVRLSFTATRSCSVPPILRNKFLFHSLTEGHQQTDFSRTAAEYYCLDFEETSYLERNNGNSNKKECK